MNHTKQAMKDVILKAVAEHPQVDDPRLVKGHGRGHNFDEDAVCADCGFDGAEWYWWKKHTYEGKAHPEAKPPLCTHTGRDVDVWPPLKQD